MKRTISHIVIFNLMISFLFTFGCRKSQQETPEARKERIEKAVAEKFAKRRAERMLECKKNAIRIAELRVDSMLLAQAKLIPVDTIDKPPVPIKPDQPIITLPKDSTEIKPLFEEIPDTIQ